MATTSSLSGKGSLIGALGVLALATIAAWMWTYNQAAGMALTAGTMGQSLLAFVVLWAVMMAAMMIPSVAPAARLYMRSVRKQEAGVTLVLRTLSFVAGYLVSWAAVGLLAYGVAAAGGWLAEQAPQAAPWAGAAALAAAGIYQLTPAKRVCLAHCRSPLSLLIHFGNYRGRLRDWRVGVYHGAYCVGCCWGLMVVLIALGVMNLGAMAVLALVIFVEKTWRHGMRFGLVVGVVLLALACAAPAHPQLIPGVTAHMSPMMPAANKM